MDFECSIKQLPEDKLVAAAKHAIQINPVNASPVGALAEILNAILLKTGNDAIISPEHLAMLVSKSWGPSGVHLTVGFLDNAPADLQRRIVDHANAWGEYANVEFRLTNTDPQIRIARDEQAYYSYLGVDNLHVSPNEHTMMLGGFTMQTRESEYRRVVRHEFGHVLAFGHEHQRRQEVARLDPQKTIAYFMQTQGWSANMVRQQVLTPLDEVSIRGTPDADDQSIMMYSFPASITLDGQPIPGGTDIDVLDGQFAASLYPKVVEPPKPPPPPNPNGGGNMAFLKILAILKLIQAGDWLGAMKLFLELLTATQSGAISAADLCDAADGVKAAAIARGVKIP